MSFSSLDGQAHASEAWERDPAAEETTPTGEPSPANPTLPEAPPAPAPTRRRRWWVLGLVVGLAVIGGTLAPVLTRGTTSRRVAPATGDHPPDVEDLLHPTHDLLGADFRVGAEPFEVGETSFATFDRVGGTYRITSKVAGQGVTSVGDFVRVAYAVGVRAELVLVTETGTMVGVMCVGPPAGGGEGLVGYGFFVEPGGAYTLTRQNQDGNNHVLREGTDTRIDNVERVAIMCAPDFDGSVTLLGFANGLMVATADDPEGYTEYTYAGITVKASHEGTVVRFTRVLARVPDEDWVP